MKSVNDGESLDDDHEPLFQEQHDDSAEKRTNVRIILAVVIVSVIFVVVLFGSVALGVALNKGCGSTIECLASEVRSNMDTSVDPCKDFYKYSCGGWERKYTISPSVTRVTRFGVLNQKNVISLSNTIESGKDGNVPAVKLARKFYDSCMNTGQLDEMGPQPLLQLVKFTGGWNLINIKNSSAPSEWSLNSAEFIDSHALGNPAFFEFSVTVDPRNTSRHMAQISQSGLTLGSADLYKIPQQVTNLQNFISKVLGMLGASSSSSQAASIVAMEKELANIFVSSDVRDPYAKYNPTPLTTLNAQWSDFNWDVYVKARLGSVGITPSDDLIVNILNPSYFSNLPTVYNKFSSSAWENYFKWQLVHTYLPYLGTNHLQAIHSFHQATEGVAADSSRAFTCISALQTVVPYTLARLYTKYILPNGTREEMSDIVTSIKTAFIDQLENNTWLDQQTINASIDKVNAIIENVAYPEFVFNDSAIYERSKPIIRSGGAFFDTHKEYITHSIQTQLALLNKTVNRYQWLSAPTQVNAFYTPLFNKFEFEEGILNSPFFAAGWPNYFKFGAIGMVAGHELTHGFDDQGHQYNKQGDLTRWWTNASLEAFNERAQCFVSQYSSYTLQGHQINGQRTLGENIADNGGLKTAYGAYRDNINSSMSQVTLPSIDLTSDQLFFVAFSQLWCGLYSDNGLTRLVSIDPHSPGPIRVLGTLSNSAEFATAFNCPVNSPMNPSKKCVLW